MARDLFGEALGLAVEEAVCVDGEGRDDFGDALGFFVGVGADEEGDPVCPAGGGQAGDAGAGFGVGWDEEVLAAELLVEVGEFGVGGWLPVAEHVYGCQRPAGIPKLFLGGEDY